MELDPKNYSREVDWAPWGDGLKQHTYEPITQDDIDAFYSRAILELNKRETNSIPLAKAISDLYQAATNLIWLTTAK